MNQAEHLLPDYQSLTQLPVGEKASIKQILPQGKQRRRLFDLGLVPGTNIEIVRRSSGNHLTAINIRGAIIALRQQECNEIIVDTARPRRR